MQENTPDLDDEDDFDRPSKSQLKRDMTALQKLGVELMAMPETRWVPLALPEILYDALRHAKKITNFEGKRRQVQYIGKLMRKIDAEPVREAVAAFNLGHAQDSLRLHQSERWRDRLLASDDALPEFLAEHVEVDIQQLRNLVRAARKDAASVADKPETQRQGRAFRELFQFIKASEVGADE